MCLINVHELHSRICKLEHIIVKLSKFANFNISPELCPNVCQEENCEDNFHHEGYNFPTDVNFVHGPSQNIEEYDNDNVEDGNADILHYPTNPTTNDISSYSNEQLQHETEFTEIESTSKYIPEDIFSSTKIEILEDCTDTNDPLSPEAVAVDNLDDADVDLEYKIDVDDSSDVNDDKKLLHEEINETLADTEIKGNSGSGESDDDPSFYPSESSSTTSEFTPDINIRSKNRKKTKSDKNAVLYEPLHVPLHSSLPSIPHVLLKQIAPEKLSTYKIPSCSTLDLEKAVKNHFQKDLQNSSNFTRKCPYCTKTFCYPSHLKMHLRRHTRPYECHHCSSTFHWERQLNAHLKNNHEFASEESNQICYFCHEKFKTSNNLLIHVRKHTAEKPFKCKKCKFTYREEIQLLIHSWSKHLKKEVGCTHSQTEIKDNQIKCAFCPYSSSMPSKLREHSEAKHSEKYANTFESFSNKSYKCPYCIFSGTNNVNIKNHIFSFHSPVDIRPFQCSLCPKTFKFTDAAKKHLKGHSKERTIPCRLCSNKFRNQSALTQHIKNRHTEVDESKLPICYFCNLKCKTKMNLFTHLGIHTGERPNKCPKCPHATIETSQLKRHMRNMHSKRKGQTLPCPHCPCKFTLRGALNTHINKSHSKTKGMLKCKLCQYEAINAGFLKMHVKKEHPKGGRNYECTFCKMKFICYTLMETHLRVHTGERPYKCVKCGYASASLGNLRKHGEFCKEKRIRRGASCACDECGQKFSNESDVRRHKSRCHLEKGVIKCKHCNCIFGDKAKFRKHMKNRHDNGKMTPNNSDKNK